MKKLLKISLLISILLLAFTVVCYADEPTDNTVTGGDSEEPSTSGNYSAILEGKELVISGLPSGTYRYFADTSSSTPYETGVQIHPLTEKNGKQAGSATGLDIIQLNQDVYIHVVSTGDTTEKVADIKLTKPTINQYNSFSSLSLSSKSMSQFVFDLPFSLNTEGMKRKIRFKIGRITDSSILKLFRDKDSSCFAKLMTFAENDSNPLYDEIQTANSYSGYTAQGEIIPGSKMVDNAFYYLYAEFETEDGKYMPLKSVTLTQASVYPDQNNAWYLFFYGAKELNYDGLGGDPSVDPGEDPDDPGEDPDKPTVIPQTGEKALVFALVGMTAVVSVVLFRKNKSLKIK